MPWISRTDLEALKTENATLKGQVEAADKESPDAELVTKNAELETAVETAEAALKSEQEAHKATKEALTTTKKSLEESEAKLKPECIAASVVAALTIPDGEDKAAAHREANKPILDAVQAEVSRQVAATGHPPLGTQNSGDPKGGSQKESNLTGYDRVVSAFKSKN